MSAPNSSTQLEVIPEHAIFSGAPLFPLGGREIQQAEGVLPYQPKSFWARFRLFCYRHLWGRYADSVQREQQAFKEVVSDFKAEFQKQDQKKASFLSQLAQIPHRKTQLIEAQKLQARCKFYSYQLISLSEKIQQGSRGFKKMEKITQALGLHKNSEREVLRSFNTMQKSSVSRALRFVTVLASNEKFQGRGYQSFCDPQALQDEETPGRDFCLFPKNAPSVRIEDLMKPGSRTGNAGRGHFNMVSSIDLDRAKSPHETGIWKPQIKYEVEVKLPAASQVAGIDFHNPRESERNCASYELDRLLGWEVIVPARLASYGDQPGILMEQAEGIPFLFRGGVIAPSQDDRLEPLNEMLQVINTEDRLSFFHDWLILHNFYNLHQFRYKGGKVYQVREGSKYFYTVDFNWNDPKLRRDLFRLQVEDYLTGQLDRHGGNILVKVTPDGECLSLKGIDNDICLGPHFLDHERIMEDKRHNVVLPPCILDTEMVQVLENSQRKEAFLASLRDNGFVQEEIMQVDARWNQLVKRIEEAKSAMRDPQGAQASFKGKIQRNEMVIISPDEWGEIELDILRERQSYWSSFQKRYASHKNLKKIPASVLSEV